MAADTVVTFTVQGAQLTVVAPANAVLPSTSIGGRTTGQLGKTSLVKPAADSSQDDDGMPLAVPIGIGAALLALGGGTWWLKRRRSGAA
ncbi:hypothetical protein [Streptomyces sp. NPDC092370]|uniref:hypothetical protein n=1 Tax=Streptomyces sp. NPDC092370 TaxID=3366016 RepID=UPI0037FCD18E